MEDRNLATIKKLYELFAKKDEEGIKAIMDDDIVWQQMEGFPNGGTYHGKEAIFTHVFERFGEDWENWRAEVKEFLNAGHCIIVLGQYKGIYLRTNKAMKAEFAHFYFLEKEKIKRFVQYTDTAMVANAMHC